MVLDGGKTFYDADRYPFKVALDCALELRGGDESISKLDLSSPGEDRDSPRMMKFSRTAKNNAVQIRGGPMRSSVR